MSQSFQEIVKVANDFRQEVDAKHKNRSLLTEKYNKRLLQIAIQHGEKWAMKKTS